MSEPCRRTASLNGFHLVHRILHRGRVTNYSGLGTWKLSRFWHRAALLGISVRLQVCECK
eukprot:17654-Hanusia_phi.AAC.1